MSHELGDLGVQGSMRAGFICVLKQEYINGEYATPIWGVNTALAKDDVRSRSRLVVTYKCKQSRGLPIVITICSYLAQTHHNSVHSIQINEVVGKLWCVHLLHLMTFTTSLHLLLTSSLANAILTPYMGVAYSPLIYSCNYSTSV